MTNATKVKQTVKEQYSDIASKDGKSGCGSECGCGSEKIDAKKISKYIGYSEDELKTAGDSNLGLGCGNPVGMSKIKKGDIVLDLGSGAGIDCFIAAKKVGKEGKVIGVDFTEKMINKAYENAEKANIKNVEFRKGDIEKLPVDDDSVDVIISNCVINLAPDKAKVFKEARRVLKPGGRMFISDIVLLEELSDEQRNDPILIAGCVGGALMKDKYIEIVKSANFDIKILNEDKNISKEQYQSIPLESLLIEAIKK